MFPRARPEVLALLDDCKASAADEPRLLLADWLEDSPDPAGRARGEFVRLSCRLAGLAPGAPERAATEARLAQLRVAHEVDWLAPLLEPDLLAAWRWERGLLWVTIEKGRALSRE